jgi:hypothetical protein
MLVTQTSSLTGSKITAEATQQRKGPIGPRGKLNPIKISNGRLNEKNAKASPTFAI